MARVSIKIINAALDEDSTAPDKIVLRGVIANESLALLKTDDRYQREILPTTNRGVLAKAMAGGAMVPDIRLGMRGGNFIERDGGFYLQDDVYIIDGLQRTTSAKMLMTQGKAPRLGVTVLFNTNYQYEKKLFNDLNTTNRKLSPNVLLRNAAEDNPGLEMLYSLCLDSSFALYNRVSWKQGMQRDQLFTALNHLKVASRLHSGFSTGLKEAGFAKSAYNFTKLMNSIGRATTRGNVITYWELVDSAFGVRNVVYASAAPYLKHTFLTTLASVLADHEDFWNDHTLTISASLRKKIATFPVRDPSVANLCSGNSKSGSLLYAMLVEHINSGKRTKRLRPFASAGGPAEYEPEDEVSSDAA